MADSLGAGEGRKGKRSRIHLSVGYAEGKEEQGKRKRGRCNYISTWIERGEKKRKRARRTTGMDFGNGRTAESW